MQLSKKTGRILVLPKAKVLTNTGNVWEHLLNEKGWNKLKKDDKVLEVTAGYGSDKFPLFDLYSAALDFHVTGIFRDEIIVI